MSTRRARQHQWIVLRQKAFRYFNRYRGSYYYVWDNQLLIGVPRWRAIGRVQTEPVLYRTKLNLPQGKTKPLRLMQFTTAPFEPAWATKEEQHDDTRQEQKSI